MNDRMTPDDYRRLHEKIGSRYEARYRAALERIKGELEEERQRDLDALRRTWALDNDGPPPVLEQIGESGSAVDLYEQPRNRNERIKYVVQVDFSIGEEVSQPLIKAKFQERFPQEGEGLQGTVIAKVIRSLVKAGILRKVKEAHASLPAIFIKDA